MGKTDNIIINPFGGEIYELLKDNYLYMFYFTTLKNININLFKWENVPDTMDIRYLELTLFNNGIAGIINHENLGIINTKCVQSNKLNLYELATAYNCFSVVENYGTYDLNADDFILCMNNKLMLPNCYTIMMFAKRLYDLDSAIDTNIALQKFSAIALCDEKQRLTIENIMKKWQANIPLIIGDKSLNIDDMLKTINFNVDYVADKLYTIKEKILSDALTFLGINNIQMEKKERLTDDEVNVNNNYIYNNYNVMLSCRQQICDTFNKKFKPEKEMSVKPNDNIINDVNIFAEMTTGGGEYE